jgi:hypothetical protein
MTRMRIFSTVLADYQRVAGTYPLADGRLHPLRDALGPGLHDAVPDQAVDAWGHLIWYRANGQLHQLISYGADGRRDKDHAGEPLYSSRSQPIVDAPEPTNDLVLIGGRFVRRPFGGRDREFRTINAINAIFNASAEFAVDNNRYPGSASDFTPVSELSADLVPHYIQDLPTQDGWGRPILYTNMPSTFLLASFGEDGKPDHTYYPDLVCGLELADEGPSSEEGGDILQACGWFAHWPRGTEP